MTDTRELTVIAEALEIIDGALQSMSGRELVSSSEVADLLLDMRSVLNAGEASPVPGAGAV
ncbi:MAG: hypothetical protein AAGA17_11035 [Actinomycetota bacterium]